MCVMGWDGYADGLWMMDNYTMTYTVYSTNEYCIGSPQPEIGLLIYLCIQFHKYCIGGMWHQYNSY